MVKSTKSHQKPRTDNVRCRECDSEMSSLKGLHLHLRKHKMSLEEYYQKYHPRYDLYTKEIIKFKDRESYLKSNFNSKKNFNKWIKESPSQKVKKYLEDRLKSLYEERKPNHIFSSAELESMGDLKISIYDKYIEDGYWDYSQRFVDSSRFKKPNSDTSYQTIPDENILIDKREQNPFQFDPKNIVLLKFGDYASKNESESGRVRVERKSAMDFIGTMSKDEKRFSRELKRASRHDYHIIVVVETSVQKLLNPNYSRFSKANPQFYFHVMRKISQENDNVQFVFSNGREEAKEICRFVLANGDMIKNVDVNYLIRFYDILPSQL